MSDDPKPQAEGDVRQKIASVIRELLGMARAQGAPENPLGASVEVKAAQRLRLRQELVRLLTLPIRRDKDSKKRDSHKCAAAAN